MRLARLAGCEIGAAEREALDALDPAAPADFRELAVLLVSDWLRSRPRRVGLSGGQGTGKTTLARLIEQASRRLGMRVGTISLDDFYLSRDARNALAARVHPLFATRGPPGTHEVERCREVLRRLGEPGWVWLPRFDKGLDDRIEEYQQEAGCDLVLLEGWCLGAGPAPSDEDLARPVNRLEREADPDGAWRGAVEVALRSDYARLFRELEALVFLAAPDLEAVRRWRRQQERSLPFELRQRDEALDRFVDHYERITRRMMRELPGCADWTVRLAPDHSVAGLERVDGSRGRNGIRDRIG